MPDLTVQKRLRLCCREVLEKLDKARGHLKRASAPRLADELGELPLDPALVRAKSCFTPPDPRGQRVAEVCEKLSRDHARVHQDAGERSEAELWRVLASALSEPVDREAS